MKLPKVLVTSIDVWNTESGSDTFTNLLSNYSSDKVANIYFRSGVPSSIVCDNYFYISENDVIKSIFNRKIQSGRIVQRACGDISKKKIDDNTKLEKKRYAFFGKHRLSVFLLARELCWLLGKWKTHDLDAFLLDFKPDVLFCPVEGYIHFNRVNEYIAKKLNIPIVSYMWDDNYSYFNCNSIGEKIYRFFLRNSVFRILKKSQRIFVITPKMQNELKCEYGIISEVLTKGAIPIPKSEMNYKANNPLEVVYTGKLAYGRLETIQGISNVIKKINNNRMQISLKIYSGTELDKEEVASLSGNGVSFCGSVGQDKIASIQQHADILLMVEALEGKHKYDARLSFSTKIVDYLSSGKCILAVGPSDIAPIEYLKENELAIVCNNMEELENILLNSLTTENLSIYVDRCKEFVRKEHNIFAIQEKLYSAFISATALETR